MKKNFAAEEVVIAITMGIMTLLTAGNVIARKVFQSSFSFVEEITIILFIVSTLLGTAIAAKRNQHMGFSGLTEILGKKGRLIFEVLGELVCIAFFILVFWHGIGMVQGEIRSGMTTPALGLPEWIYGLSIPVGALFIVFRYLGRMKSVFIKRGGEE
ncbi:MAG: TRAP transporter small permease [Peptostreptococcaceae bacterium]|nr:TRAP transporter small permease [Peptostreptococcaceae bacterium]